MKTRCEWSFTSVSVGSNRAKQTPSLWLINDEDYILGIYVGPSMNVKYPWVSSQKNMRSCCASIVSNVKF